MAKPVETILHVDASQRRNGSVSRGLSRLVVEELCRRFPGARIVRQDLGRGVPLVDDRWIDANDTPATARTPEQMEVLRHSDALVEQIRSADVWVIGTPIYNFSIPPVLKAWIDQICRARVTFAYSEQGPRGLLEDRKVFVTIASGGSKVGSEWEFLTPYLRHVLAFIGIRDVDIIAAEDLTDAAKKAVAAAK